MSKIHWASQNTVENSSLFASNIAWEYIGLYNCLLQFLFLMRNNGFGGKKLYTIKCVDKAYNYILLLVCNQQTLIKGFTILVIEFLIMITFYLCGPSYIQGNQQAVCKSLECIYQWLCEEVP